MQRPNPRVRADIVAAATSLFADAGYAATTMADVAARAGTAIGNVYRYFRGKEALFAAVLPRAFADELRKKTRRQIAALGRARDIDALPRDARYHVLSGELLDFSIANRERVIILLDRAEGTPFAGFAGDFATRLVAWALAYARGAYPTVRPSRAMRFALAEIYPSHLRSVARALAAFRSEAEIRDAVAQLTLHHRGGLKRLFETAASAARRAR